MMMDFGILKISADMEFEDNLPLERVFVLLTVKLKSSSMENRKGYSPTYTNDTIWSVNLPKDIPVKLRGIATESEIRSHFELKMNVISCR